VLGFSVFLSSSGLTTRLGASRFDWMIAYAQMFNVTEMFA